MKKYLGIILVMATINIAGASVVKADQSQAVASDLGKTLSETKMVSLVKYEGGIAVFQVEACPIDVRIDIDVKFIPSKDPSLVYAELSFYVPDEQCYSNTSQQVTVSVQEKIKEVALLKGIKATYILMKSIPNRIEVDQF